MNIVINCPHCDQEMIIDESGVGETVNCPSCSQEFVIPQGRPEEEVRLEREATQAKANAASAHAEKNEAPKKEESKKEDKKPMPSKEELAALLPGAQRGRADAKAAEDAPGIKVKSIQHHLCIDMGKDTFDAQVAKLLNSIPREDIINVSPLSYSYKDSGGDIIADYGVIVIYEKKEQQD